MPLCKLTLPEAWLIGPERSLPGWSAGPAMLCPGPFESPVGNAFHRMLNWTLLFVRLRVTSGLSGLPMALCTAVRP
jgi:hypothetical protein